MPAKLVRPRNARAHARQRLFALLDQADAGAITWVSAPAGAGKTTLASSYHDARKRPCLWYLLDEGDGDAASFFHYLKLAASRISPRKAALLPAFGPEYAPNIALFARRFFEALCADLRPPFGIVFDDYQTLAPSSPVHEALAAGLAALPPGVRATIVSRAPPPQPFARLRANGALALLGWDDLRFTLEETRALLRATARRDPAGDTARQLHETTDGWVAGMMLVLGRPGTEAPSLQRLATVARGEVFDYFAAELFSRMDAPTRAFLLRTAFLPHVPPGIAGELCGADAGRILDDLSREQLFTVRGDSADGAYRYHPLFREFLMQRAREELGEAQCAALQVRAGALLEQAGEHETAAELFIAARHWEDLARLVRERAGGLLGQGRGEVVRRWIEAMPPAHVEGTPWVSFWLAACLLGADPAASRRLFEHAFAQFRAAGERTGMFLAWSAAAGAVLHQMDYRAGADWIATLDEVRAEDASYPSPEVERQVTMNAFNMLALGTPEHSDVPELRERAYAFIFGENATADPNLFLMTACYLTTHLMWRGEFERGTLVIETLKPLARARGASDLVLIVAKSMEALGAIFTAEPEVAIESGRAALRIAEESGVHVWDTHLLGHALGGALSNGDEAALAELMPRMAALIHDAREMDRGYYHLLVSWKAMRDGQWALALRHLDLVAESVKFVRYPPVEIFARAYRAEMLYRTGSDQDVDALIARACDDARLIHSPVTLFHCLVAKAALAFERAREDEGLQALQEAMALGRRHGIYNIHCWRPALMTALAMRALDAGLEVGYVQELVRRRGLMPQTPPAELAHWPWPVRIRVLGQFEVERDGKPLAFDRKAPQKPLALLKLLAAHGGRSASIAELSDALWPQADGDSARHAFKTTLQRLRKLIGEECLPLREGRLGLDARFCWVDCWAFERLSALRNVGRALELYRGDLLAAETDAELAAQVMAYRRRLRQQYEALSRK